MSIAIMTAVWARGPEEQTSRFVLLSIADNADETGFAYPRIEYTRRRVCASKSTVLRCLKTLEAEGWVTVQRKANAHKGNTYLINLAKLGLLEPKERLVPTGKRSGVSLTLEPQKDASTPSGVTVKPESGVSLTPGPKSQVSSTQKSGVKQTLPPDPLFGRTVSRTVKGGEPSPQAPPSAPEQSYDFAADSGAEIPEGLTPLQYAAGVLEQCGVLGGFKMRELAAEAVRLIAKSERLTPAKAATALLGRMQEARRGGKTLNNFWFTDEGWRPATPTAASIGSAASLAGRKPGWTPESAEEMESYGEAGCPEEGTRRFAEWQNEYAAGKQGAAVRGAA